MPILRKLKSLLGADDADEGSERDVTVTVEHDPENEAAVKGADVDESATAGGSHAVAVSDSEADEGGGATGASAEPTGDETQEPAAEGAADSAADDEGAGEQDAASEAIDEVEIPDAEDADEAEDDGADETADADETETADAEPVDVLSGIGPAYAQRLGDAGIETVDELAQADAAALADTTGIAEGRIQGWIDQAGEY